MLSGINKDIQFDSYHASHSESGVFVSPLHSQKGELKSQLENLSVSNPDVKRVRILVAGQIGAGKSSFINSVFSAF